ncbi:helix-turn-helix domain-containing protein [Streptomyces sp. NPDC051561]|uniref:helix-turn-helix domain-containing protein n=1 Tax=Streptomyces sp. NPDC051561 TaxID=3365658 RepID=UPI0037B3BA56
MKYRHTNRYCVVGNHLSQHPEMSLTAIGLGVHIQSLPDGVRIGIKELAQKFREGEIRIGAALRELVKFGYLERQRVQVAYGRYATVTTFFEHPAAKVRAAFESLTGSSGSSPRSTPAEPEPRPEPEPVPEPQPRPLPEPAPDPTTEITLSPTPLRLPPPAPQLEVTPERHRLACTLLAGLRVHDPRLHLPHRDVERLAPAVCAWLERGISPQEVQDVLLKGLRGSPVRHPAGLVEWRLAELLPFESLERPRFLYPARMPVERQHPFQTCEECGLAVRAPQPGVLCRSCQEGSDADLAAFVLRGGFAS